LDQFLEATAARVRAFLDQARTVEESLKINGQLSELEGQIEQVKGQLIWIVFLLWPLALVLVLVWRLTRTLRRKKAHSKGEPGEKS